VISTDEALAEITGGYATVAADLAPVPLAAAIGEALATTPAQLEAAYRHIEPFTWAATADAMRTDILAHLAR
jgi:hypothetical protein